MRVQSSEFRVQITNYGPRPPVPGPRPSVPGRRPTPDARRIMPLLLIIGLMLPSLCMAADIDKTVDRIQKTFAGIKDIKGTFSQTSYIKDLEQTQEYRGRFFIKKPSRMMWEYDKPRDEKVVIKDTNTWIYKKSENQVIRTKFSKEAYSQAPIAFMESFENLKADFDITMPEENALNLVPEQKTGSVKMLVMEIKEGDFPVNMFTVIDTYGNIIMIDLKDVEINPGLDETMFDFEIPEGAEVFDMER